MTRALGLLGVFLLASGPALAQPGSQPGPQHVWICTLTESQQFVNGKEITQKGGGDYRIEIKPPSIELTANGHYIIGYDIAEDSENRLLGERTFDPFKGAVLTAKLFLDKVNGRIIQSGLSLKGGSQELVEVTNGRCRR